MGKIFLLCIIVVLVFSTGCSSYLSNLTASPHNLKPDEYAVFEKEGNRFSAQIQHLEGRSGSSRITEVIVTIQVKNTGNKAVSLMAYPRLSEVEGNQYAGTGVFVGMISPGGVFTGKSSIAIPSDAAYKALEKKTALSVRFQDPKLIPYEATWDIDITAL
jgi:hypothetical protein